MKLRCRFRCREKKEGKEKEKEKESSLARIRRVVVSFSFSPPPPASPEPPSWQHIQRSGYSPLEDDTAELEEVLVVEGTATTARVVVLARGPVTMDNLEEKTKGETRLYVALYESRKKQKVSHKVPAMIVLQAIKGREARGRRREGERERGRDQARVRRGGGELGGGRVARREERVKRRKGM